LLLSNYTALEIFLLLPQQLLPDAQLLLGLLELQFATRGVGRSSANYTF